MMCTENGGAVGNVSKTDILRGIISERLNTATREILAVVERTVADYEEEASGFKQEIDRQRRQLELLQPRVKLEKRGVEESRPSIQQDDDDDDDEEEQLWANPTTSSTLRSLEAHNQQVWKELNPRMMSSFLKRPEPVILPSNQTSASFQPNKKKIRRPQISDSLTHLDFRIRILEDSEIDIITNAVFKQSPSQNLRVPRGLQEAEFLALLRSTFPQLSNDKPFDFFISDIRRRLHPLNVESRTPEKIYRVIKSARTSTLYIRLKSDKGRPQISDSQTHLDFQIRILEDSYTNTLSNNVSQKSPLLNMRCPRGLQEAEFLDLLRTTFPQLSVDQPLEFFISDINRKLQPLEVESMSPEEIYRAISSARNTTLYIRLKSDKRMLQTHLDFQIQFLKDSYTDLLSNNVFQKSPLQNLRCPRGLQEAEFLDLLRYTFPQLGTSEPFKFCISDSSRKLQAVDVESMTPEEIYRVVSSTENSTLYIRLKPDIPDTSTNLDFKIRILEGSQSNVLSNIVFKQCPVQSLRCPHDLPEAGFVELLRSTFPQLGTDEPFDFLISDISRKLHPLHMDTRTPVEVYRSMRVNRCSTLFIRRKQPEIPDTSTNLDFKIRILEGSQSNVLSNTVFKQCPVQSLRCPRDLPEAGFVELLRSTFPQLGTNEPFDFLISDISRKLHPLHMDTRTPVEVYRSMRVNRCSTLYIRRKTEEDLQSLSKEADASSFSSRRDRSYHSLRACMLENLLSENPSENVLVRSPIMILKCPRGLTEADFLNLLRTTFPQLAEAGKPFNLYKCDGNGKLEKLNMTMLKPEEIYVAMKSTGVKKPILYIKVKAGEEEEEELNLLPDNDGLSTTDEAVFPLRAKVDDLATRLTSRPHDPQTNEEEVPQQVNNWMPDQPKKAKNIVLKRKIIKNPCKVCGISYNKRGNLVKHAWDHMDEPQCVCGVCGECLESAETLKGHLQDFHKIFVCLVCRKSFSKRRGIGEHSCPGTQNKEFTCSFCSKTFQSLSRLRTHHWIHMEERPYKCDMCLKSFGFKGQLTAHRKTHTRKESYQCNICGKSVTTIRSLILHKSTHTGRRPHSCEHCGKHFTTENALKVHKAIHMERERRYLCHLCSKSFLTGSTLKAHLLTHSSEKPFVCAVCNKGFSAKGDLKRHTRVHTGERPYGCSKCDRFFKDHNALKAHISSHQGIKPFICSVCGKGCRRREHLMVHMRTHSGEKPYKCTVCEKAFSQSHCLKTHMKSHQAEEGNPEHEASSS
ncbi:uncharacterized protein KZ484_019981 isoform 2-T2 [Pholidichthys leucotaenia]